MIRATSFADENVAVFGLGASGKASVHSLLAGGAHVTAWDDKLESQAELPDHENLKVKDLRDIDWHAISSLVLSPGVPLTHPEPHWTVKAAQAHEVEIIGDTEIFERERDLRGKNSKLVAITGTNGKSTTTALVAHMLSELGENVEMGGNIGKAILSLADFGSAVTYVIEYSSYQIDLTPSLKPDVGILLNITPDHLDRHGTLEHYADVKARLVHAASNYGVAIVGIDDHECQQIADKIEQKNPDKLKRLAVERITQSSLYAHNGEIYHMNGGDEKLIADISEVLTLRGQHNWQNASAAAAVALAFNHQPSSINSALASFKGLAHRMEILGKRDKVLFVNDSKATNAEAAAMALASFEDIYWIVGGRSKSGGIETLEHLFDRVSHAYLVGESAENFAKTLNGKVTFTISRHLSEAVKQAERDAMHSNSIQPVVLLSPACASFDQYRNFEIRGDAFREHVGNLEVARHGS